MSVRVYFLRFQVLLPAPRAVTPLEAMLAEELSGDRAAVLDLGDAGDAVLDGANELEVRGAEVTESARALAVKPLSR